MKATVLVALVEGSSDDAFFRDVLRKVVRDAVSRHPDQQAVADVEVLRNGSASRGEWVRNHVRRLHPEADVIAIHVDGSAKPERELRNRYAPVEEAWRRDPPTAARMIPLVPVREMESWALADLTVLRAVVGVEWDSSLVSQAELLATPEKLADPKRTLADILAQARRPRRRPRSIDSLLPLLAEKLDLPALRRLPSFQRFELDLQIALNDSMELE